MNAEYPFAPGTRGIETSNEAADAIASIANLMQQRVLRFVQMRGSYGATSHEIAVGLSIEHGTVQPRTSELKLLGKLRDGGVRRRNPSGKRAIAWVAIGGGE